MAIINRILCPVDFSETAEKAFQYAAQLCGGTGAELVICHAFDVPATLDMAGQSNPANPDLRNRLAELRVPSDAIQVKRVLHAGAPGEVICWLAQQHECDLIVMGTHGRTGLKHLLFGSTAEYVLRHARSPVLTIRNRPVDEPSLREPTVLPVPPPRLM